MEDKLGPIEIEFVLDGKAEQKAIDLKKALDELIAATKELREGNRQLITIQKTQAEANEKGAASQAKIEKSVLGATKALGWLSVGVTLFKGIINSSSSATAQFKSFIDGAKGAVEELFSSVRAGEVTIGDLASNMVKGAKAAKEFSDNTYSYTRAMKAAEVIIANEQDLYNELEKIYRNSSLSPEKREQAINDYIAKKKEEAATLLKIEEKYHNDLLTKIKSKPRLEGNVTDDDLNKFATIYAKNAELIGQIQDLRKKTWMMTDEAFLDSSNEKGFRMYGDAVWELRKSLEETLPAGIEMADVLKVLWLNGELNTKTVDAMSESYIRLGNAKAKSSNVEADLSRMLGDIKKNNDSPAAGSIDYLRKELAGLQKDYYATADAAERASLRIKILAKQSEIDALDPAKLSEEEKKKAKALRDILNEIAVLKSKDLQKELLQLEQAYNEDLKTYEKDQKIKTALTEKYNLERYEIEQAYLKKIKEENSKLLQLVYIPNSTKSSSTPSSIINPYTSSGLYDWGKYNPVPDANKNKSLKEEMDLRMQILDAVAQTTSQLGEMLDISSDIASAFDSIANLIDSIATENWTSAAASLLSYVLTVMEMYEYTERYNSILDDINDKLKESQRIVEQSERTGGSRSAQEQYVDTIAYQISRIEYQISVAEYKLRHATILNYESRQEDLENLQAQLLEMQQTYEDAQLALNDIIAGGITPNTIADAIYNGIVNGGKEGADTLSDYLREMLQGAAAEIFKDRLLSSAQMNELMNYVREALSDFELDTAERDKIMTMGQQFAETMQPFWDGLNGVLDAMSGTEDEINALEGQIKGMSADQASLIAGQLNAVRISQATSQIIMQDSLKELFRIGNNTDHLISIDSKLDALVSNPLRAQGIV
jgi:hypothetical protein